MRKFSITFAIVASAHLCLAADFAPAIQWVKTLGGSGTSLVAAAASDGRGNLYITGSTTSPDFPNTGTAQRVSANSDVFAVKLDGDGNIVYSAKFGGSYNEIPAALAVGADGSLYVTGSTVSSDLPVTPGAYLPTIAANSAGGSNFVIKLNPDGSLAWATYFPGQAVVAAIAVDSAGNSFIGGFSTGGLPTTPGAYQTTFQQTVGSNGFFAVIGPPAAFVTKLNAKGTGLIYSTYISSDNRKNTVQGARALAVDAAGNAWIGVGVNPNIVPSGGANASVVELNPTGSAVVASAAQPGLDNVAALALDADSNVYVAGSYSGHPDFPATPGAFQSAPQPAMPLLPFQPPAGGGQDAFVARWDSSLSHLLAATLVGGELPDIATSIAVDASGTVIVAGYSDSKDLPTHAPFQESFSSRAGFVAGFDASLSSLLFSTYLGDGRPFAAQTAVPDGRGGILLAGSTLSIGRTFIGGDNGASFTEGNLVVANRIDLTPPPAVRLDTVQNFASHIAGPLAPGEPVVALGAGLGNGAQLVVDGSPLPTVSATTTAIVAVLPDSTAITGVHTVQVSSGGTLSNSLYAPAAPAAPGIYAVDGSGVGQGLIFNSDGTLNSPSNPAALGSPITIFVAGAGQYTLDHGYAVAAQMPSVYVDGFYCNGIAAVIGPVDGLPGNVYQLSVFLPDLAALIRNNPDLKNFQFPAQSPIQLAMGTPNPLNSANSPMISQAGIFINIK